MSENDQGFLSFQSKLDLIEQLSVDVKILKHLFGLLEKIRDAEKQQEVISRE